MGGVVAVMQPYLFPYAGYFRLLAMADTFVILDDVQFPRRGRVHRCEVPRGSGGIEWLTLPLTRASRDTTIKDVTFPSNARDALDARLRRLPWLERGEGALAAQVRAHLRGPLGAPHQFITAGLALVADALELPARRINSSSLDIDRSLRGQDRIIALARAVGGDIYLNSPGGRELYDAAPFAAAGLTLKFLTPYCGRFEYLLPALMTEAPAALRQDIAESSSVVA